MSHPEELKKAQLNSSGLESSAVYGPVRSWRVGMSLGIDLLLQSSICSFNCTYCQLGSIQVRTRRRQLFVPTGKVLADLEESRWRQADVITFSGSGEPTLASNLGEVVRRVKERTGKEILLLTNGTLFLDPQVRQEASFCDQVFVKLDAATEATFQHVNRPVEGIKLSETLRGIRLFRSEYEGHLGVQSMFLHSNEKEVEELCSLLRQIEPDEVQVNTPTRPYPPEWYLQSRGSHEGVDYPARALKPVSPDRLQAIVEELRNCSRQSRRPFQLRSRFPEAGK